MHSMIFRQVYALEKVTRTKRVIHYSLNTAPRARQAGRQEVAILWSGGHTHTTAYLTALVTQVNKKPRDKVHEFNHLSIHLSIYRSIPPSLYGSVLSSIHLFAGPSFGSSNKPAINRSTHPSTHAPMYPCVHGTNKASSMRSFHEL